MAQVVIRKEIQQLGNKRAFNNRQDKWLPIIQKLIIKLLRKQLRQALTILRKTGSIGLTLATLTPSMFVKDTSEILRKIWNIVANDFAQITFDVIQKAMDPAFVSDVQAAILLQLANRGANIADITVAQLEGILLVAVEEGKSINEAAKMLQIEFNRLGPNRAKKIARTEINSASNLGGFEAVNFTAKQNDLTIKKIWITAGDARVRPSHREVSREVVPIDDRFSNGMLYPGDPAGGAGEVINCRCTLTYKVDD
ncbi:MAG: phage minor head protein [Candidatus Heimdallarchaeota archaeon]